MPQSGFGSNSIVIHRDSSKAMGKEVAGMMYKPSVFCHDTSHNSITCPKVVSDRQSMETGWLVGSHRIVQSEWWWARKPGCRRRGSGRTEWAGLGRWTGCEEGGRGGLPAWISATGGGRNIAEVVWMCSRSRWFPYPSYGLGLLSTFWHTQHTLANQLWFGPFSPAVAKTSGKSIECSDRPFLLKENASYFQRNGYWVFGTLLYLQSHGNREHTDRSCLQLYDLRFTEWRGGQFLKAAFGFYVLFPSWPSITS